LEVVVHEPGAAPPTIGRALMGPLARIPARYEVRLIDRTTRKTVLRAKVDRSRHDAQALAALWQHDLEHLDEVAFLKRHGRGNRGR
jgi:hypothetical protein